MHVHFLLILSSVYTNTEIVEFGVYTPSDAERQDPRLYADNVCRMMAQELGVPVSSSVYADKRRYHKAIRAGQLPHSWHTRMPRPPRGYDPNMPLPLLPAAT